MFDGRYVIFDDSRYVGLVSPRQASLLNINCPDVVLNAKLPDLFQS